MPFSRSLILAALFFSYAAYANNKLNVYCSSNLMSQSLGAYATAPGSVYIYVSPKQAGDSYYGMFNYAPISQHDQNASALFDSLSVEAETRLFDETDSASNRIESQDRRFIISLYRLVRIVDAPICNPGQDCRQWLYAASADVMVSSGRRFHFNFASTNDHSYCSVTRDYQN